MTTVWTVRSIAADDASDPALRPLPAEAVRLLDEIGAPPRLVAHLRAVHDVAAQLVEWIARHCPGLPVDREAVLFGAATHDIGKTLHPEELSGPGARHEEAGRELLPAHGGPAGRARFAATHASWAVPGVAVEDLLVSLADKVWKNKRVADLEDRVVAELARAGGRPVWQEFLDLDEFLTAVGEGTELRLAWQAAHPVHG
ncbi:HD domain-containing protein [Streptomyces sp. ME08-AFT2]|uniref:HD domain-containing protein n=1 Tax=Streptomyces sp. ME08-AFT2 TaxID=3028683 RepID=UPI0029B00CCD|nr:HD domain-containing protein [Streptomyces sp. ME08-AFT2]MDX3311657.1 HD domain-containing protein [Streptomyces sp. ME08-AFT2]